MGSTGPVYTIAILLSLRHCSVFRGIFDMGALIFWLQRLTCVPIRNSMTLTWHNSLKLLHTETSSSSLVLWRAFIGQSACDLPSTHCQLLFVGNQHNGKQGDDLHTFPHLIKRCSPLLFKADNLKRAADRGHRRELPWRYLRTLWWWCSR